MCIWGDHNEIFGYPQRYGKQPRSVAATKMTDDEFVPKPAETPAFSHGA